MSFPHWLPEMFPVDPWTDSTYDQLYKIFKSDFIENRPTYLGRSIHFFPDKEDGREKIFWHLTSRDDKATAQRLPDLRRAERLPWAKPTIENTDKSEILHWDYEEGDGVVKTYIWLKDYDYLVIMKKFPSGDRRIITAYWVEYENEKKKLGRKYRDRLSA